MRNVELLRSRGAKWDKQDDALIERHTWFIGGSDGRKRYVYRQVRTKSGKQSIYLHRELMAVPRGIEVDHINGDSLDNRRCNLRLASRLQNVANRGPNNGQNKTSKYKGVSLDRRNGKWVASMYEHRRRIKIGSFDSEAEAANAYNRAALDRFGEFAYQNDIQKGDA